MGSPNFLGPPRKVVNPGKRTGQATTTEFELHPPEEITFDTEEIPTKDIPMGTIQHVKGTMNFPAAMPPHDGSSELPYLGKCSSDGNSKRERNSF